MPMGIASWLKESGGRAVGLLMPRCWKTRFKCEREFIRRRALLESQLQQLAHAACKSFRPPSPNRLVKTLPLDDSQANHDSDSGVLARTLLGYSLELRTSEVVLISGTFAAEPLICELFLSATQIGALPVLRILGDLCLDTTVNCNGKEKALYLNPFRVPDGTHIDATVGIWTVDDGMNNCIAERHHAEPDSILLSNFLEAAAVRRCRWVAAVYPTESGAKRARMTLDEYGEFVKNAGFLNEEDPTAAWLDLGVRQRALCRYLESVKEIQITTSDGTRMRANVEGRKWISCDGHRNFPGGEVFTAPIENTVNGVFFSSYPIVHDGVVIVGARLEFHEGQIVRATAAKGRAALLRMIDRDEGARYVGEIGIGTNYRIQQATGTSLIDEKIGGTVHVGIGAAYPETGGKNRSSVHRDFIADLRTGGRIEADGVIANRNGCFVNADWPKGNGPLAH